LIYCSGREESYKTELLIYLARFYIKEVSLAKKLPFAASERLKKSNMLMREHFIQEITEEL